MASMVQYGLVTALSVLLIGCDIQSTVSNTRYRAVIRVDGTDYTSEIIGRVNRNVTWGNFTDHPYGRVLTFRLPDNRVVVVNLRYKALQCVPRADGTDGGCADRWSGSSTASRGEDGYIFDDAIAPTSVEAFQFEPRSPQFAPNGAVAKLNGQLSIRATSTRIELVSYEARTSNDQPRDTLARDFLGFTSIRNVPPYQLVTAASDLHLPSKRK